VTKVIISGTDVNIFSLSFLVRVCFICKYCFTHRYFTTLISHSSIVARCRLMPVCHRDDIQWRTQVLLLKLTREKPYLVSDENIKTGIVRTQFLICVSDVLCSYSWPLLQVKNSSNT